MTAGSQEALAKLLTAYDNSGEPKPFFNYVHNVYGLIITFMIVSWICVSWRLYVRVAKRCLGWDDFFVVLFRISATIGSIFICLSVQDGFGKHFLTIGTKNMVEFQKKFYVSLATWTVSTTLMKLCLLVQYLRIFDTTSRMRWICWAGVAICSLWGLGFSFCALFPCFPVSGFWDWTSDAVCYGFGSKEPAEISGVFAGHTASNVVMDLVVLAIPVPLYFEKTATWRQRLGLGILLLIGVIVNLLSIWRLQTIVENKAGTFPVMDPTWYGPKSIILAALEVDLASICASIPIFWPVIKENFNKIFVTQEVHITHQHRRLSGGEDQIELQTSDSHHSRVDSDVSLNAISSSMSKTAPELHYQDKYVMNSVIPLGIDKKEATSESLVMSEGQKGFKRREQERLSEGLSSLTRKMSTKFLG
ncbi:hypothetical protein F4778DRAFT_771802 [Xylariomycetidae sp. FL2044]|nr:hypothetical protein F4778DRAFT_771802 [Xylariomycetidae sp. FL2044]